MLDPGTLDKIIALPQDAQRSLITWLSSSTHSAHTKEDIVDKYDITDIDDIIEIIAHINNLFRRNNPNRFFEILDELNVPEQIKLLYVPNDGHIENIFNTFEIKWRTDITVPNANSVLINVKRNDGQHVCLRLDIGTFHKFRFNVTLMLNDLIAAKKRYLRFKKF